MHSDLIGKIEKARRYAQEPERIALGELKAHFHGGNSNHDIVLSKGHWTCTCSFFRNWGTCAHIMAMQKILNPMLTDEARQAEIAIELHSDSVAV
jgi:predicted nucleic acid-binding Zn finger protein